MNLDYKKYLEAAKAPIIIGTVAQIVLLIAFFGLTRIADKSLSDIVMLALIAFSFIFYLALFIWSGYRAVKQFGYDILGAGLVSAAAYLGIGIISLLLVIAFFIVFAIIIFLGYGNQINGGSAPGNPAANLTGGALGAGLLIMVALMTFVIYIFELAIGACINLGVGCLGGWLASRK